MSYYQLKCLHCGKLMENSNVVFKMDRAEMEKTADDLFGSGGNSNAFSSASTSASSAFSTSGGMGSGMSTTSNSGVGNSEVVIYLTYKELLEKAEEQNKVGKKADVIALVEKDIAINAKNSKTVADEPDRVSILSGDLITGVQLKDLQIGDKKMTGIIKKRRCCRCHRLLSQNSGKMPTYTLGLIGHSSAGKTVYFTVLHRYLQQNLVFPFGKLSSINDLSCRELGEKDEFEQFCRTLDQTGRLPSTTESALNQPYCRVFTLTGKDKNGNEIVNRCLLSVRDVMGEAFVHDVNEAGFEAKDLALYICTSADGLLMITDPLVLNRARNTLGTSARAQQTSGQNELLTLALLVSNQLTDRDSKISKPSVVMVTKEDILWNQRSNLHIPADTAAIAPALSWRIDRQQDWYHNFLAPLHYSTKTLIEHLDNGEGFSPFLENTFADAAYISVSALGANVRLYPKVENNKNVCYVDPVAAINPRFLQLPLAYLLMRFGFLPPVHQSNYYANQDEMFDEWCRNKVQRINPAASDGFRNEFSDEKKPDENQGKKRNIFSLLKR